MAYIPPNQMASAGSANAQQSQVSPTPSAKVPMGTLDQARAQGGYGGSIPPAVPAQSSPAVPSPQPGQAALSPAPQTSAVGTAGTPSVATPAVQPAARPVAQPMAQPAVQPVAQPRPTLPAQASPTAQAAVAKQQQAAPAGATALTNALARVPEQARPRVLAALQRVTGPQQAALNQRVQALQARGLSPEQVQAAVAPELKALELATQQALAGMNIGVPMSSIDQLRAARGNFNAR